MRLILRGDKLSAKKYIGFAKARLNDMKNIMNALGLNYNKKYYKLPDAELVVESRYGLDSAWIVGKGFKIVNGEFLPETLTIIVSLLSSNIPCSSFTADVISGNAPLTVTFTNTGSPNVSIWNFGDGSPVINSTNAVHTYTVPGIYDVRLTTGTFTGITYPSPTLVRRRTRSGIDDSTLGHNQQDLANPLAYAALGAFGSWSSVGDSTQALYVANWRNRTGPDRTQADYSAREIEKTYSLPGSVGSNIITSQISLSALTASSSGITLSLSGGASVSRDGNETGAYKDMVDLSDLAGTSVVLTSSDRDGYSLIANPLSGTQADDKGWTTVSDSRGGIRVQNISLSDYNDCTSTDFITVT